MIKKFLTKYNLGFFPSIKQVGNTTNCYGDSIIVPENSSVIIFQEYISRFAKEEEQRILIQTIKEFELPDKTKGKLYRWSFKRELKEKE